MVTVQFSRQEKASMSRRAGLGDAASQAMRDLPDPVDLDQAGARGHGPASPETISSAARAAAHDAVCRQPAPADGMPPPRLPRAVSTSVNAKGAGGA